MTKNTCVGFVSSSTNGQNFLLQRMKRRFEEDLALSIVTWSYCGIDSQPDDGQQNLITQEVNLSLTFEVKWHTYMYM